MVSQGIVMLLMSGIVIFGSINTITNKIINSSISLLVKFDHVWFITFMMFLGESFCIFVYLCMQKKAEEEEALEEKRNKAKISIFRLCIPPLFDLCGTTLMTFGLTMMAGSVYQMFRGSVMIFTCLLSVFYLKNRHFIFHYIGLAFVVCGLILVGVASYINDTQNGSQTSIWGILLVVLSQLFTAVQFIYEESLMKQYRCHPIKAIAWEGIWGCCYTVTLLIIFQFIECANSSTSLFVQEICTKDNKGKWTVENTIFAFQQIGDNSLILGMSLLFICSISVFNVAGIAVAKYTTGTARAVIDSVRTVVVWAFFLMEFLPESVRETFSWIQLIGFILLVIGTLIYNKVIPLPFWISVTTEQEQFQEPKEVIQKTDISLSERIIDVAAQSSKDGFTFEEEQILLKQDN